MGVDTRANGGGVVRAGVGLDADALRQIPDLAQQLKVDDLKRAGWTVVGPRKERDSRTWVRATKAFATAAQASKVVAELNGPNGPFKDFRVRRSHSFFRTKTSFSGTVDRTAGALSDPGLERQLASSGVDPKVLQQQLNLAQDRAFRLEVVTHLPGSVRSNAPTSIEGGAVWAPKSGERARLTATATAWNLRPLVFGALAVVLAVIAAIVWRRSRSRSQG